MSVWSVVLSSVHGKIGITEDGKSLLMIGNRSFSAGETVYTDGQFIYGTETKHGGSLIPSLFVFPYLDGEKLCGVNVVGKSIKVGEAKCDGALILVADERRCYLVNDHWENGATYTDLNTGRTEEIKGCANHRGTTLLHANIDDSGNLWTAWATNFDDFYNKEDILIIKNSEVVNRLPVLMAFKGNNSSWLSEPYCTPLAGYLRKDGSYNGLYITNENCSVSQQSSESEMSFNCACEPHVYFVAYSDSGVIYDYVKAKGYTASGGKLHDVKVETPNGTINPFDGYAIEKISVTYGLKDGIVFYDSKTGVQKLVSTCSTVHYHSGWTGSCTSSYFKTHEHATRPSSLNNGIISQVIGEVEGGDYDGYQIEVWADCGQAEFPRLEYESYSWGGSTSQVFEMEAGIDRKGKPIIVTYEIRATGFAKDNFFYHAKKYEITTTIKGYSMTCETSSKQGSSAGLRAFWRDNEWFINSAYECMDGRITFVKGDGFYVIEDNGIRLVTRNFKSDGSDKKYGDTIYSYNALVTEIKTDRLRAIGERLPREV